MLRTLLSGETTILIAYFLLEKVSFHLKQNRIFRGVLPDLQREIQAYAKDDQADACSNFMKATGLGHQTRPRGVMGIARILWGNSAHLWLWNYKGLANKLDSAGFASVRRASFQDFADGSFSEIEDQGRWDGCLWFECRKSDTA